jgi:hypothetical protein
LVNVETENGKEANLGKESKNVKSDIFHKSYVSKQRSKIKCSTHNFQQLEGRIANPSESFSTSLDTWL